MTIAPKGMKFIGIIFSDDRGYMRLFIFSILLAPFSVAATFALSLLIGLFYGDGSITPNSVGELAESGIPIDRVLSALLLAPLIENAICYFGYIYLGAWNERHWWKKPLLIAVLVAILHAVLLLDVRPLAVFPGFFIIAAFIAHSKNKKIGYAASVAHHFLVNLINLSLAYWLRNS